MSCGARPLEYSPESVKLLNAARWTVLVERALGHLREDPRHRIAALFRLHLGEAQHVTAVRGELAAEEVIHEVDLDEHVDKVQRLADEEAKSIKVVTIQILGEVVEENLLALLLGFVIDNRAIEIHNEHLDATTLPGLPQVTRHVEANGCEWGEKR